MGVNRPRKVRRDEGQEIYPRDADQEVSNPPEREEKNPITDPPQGEQHTEVDEG
jgi:hypothetical protein